MQLWATHEKGERFEELSENLFGGLNGVRVYRRDASLPAEEIDLVLWNNQSEEALRPWEPIILVECKNWSNPVGAPALDSFLGKMRRRGLRTGIFIAANGITGDFLTGDGNNVGASRLIESALQEGIRVVILTLGDLRLLQSVDDLRNLIIDPLLRNIC